METNKKDILYLNKNFNQFKDNLIRFAKTYYKNTFNDFTESDPGMMFIEMSAVIGDVLSFYTDYSLNESLALHATEKANILSIAQAFGYNPKPSYPAITDLDIYQILPSIGGVTPDWSYTLNIKPGMEITSNENKQIVFRTLDNINFAVSGSNNPTEITVYDLDSNGLINYYLLKKTIRVEAGQQKNISFTFTDSIPYCTVTIPDTNIISIDEVLDSDNNNWYEVPYLAQDTIFTEILNTDTNNPDLAQYKAQTPYLLKLKKISKRFTSRYTNDNKLELRFGAGVNILPDEILTPNPDNIGLPSFAGINKLNNTWDPANFIYTKSYGQVPSNTTLNIKYTIGGGIQSNVPANVLRNITKVEYYNSDLNLNSSILDTVKKSLGCNNIARASGGRGEESIEEIRYNSLAHYAAQDRIVNKEDFISKIYSMPAKYGNVSKAYIAQDDQLNLFDYTQKIANPLALNLYILSYNDQKQLIQSNKAIKENLKTYLSKYKMLTDSINIKDAFIINIAFSFQITVLPDFIANEVLFKCINDVKKYFDMDNWQINQPIIISDVRNKIAMVTGVQSITQMKFYNVFDSNQGYIPNIYDIDTATRDGIIYPSIDPSIFEVRFPNQDIYGRVVTI